MVPCMYLKLGQTHADILSHAITAIDAGQQRPPAMPLSLPMAIGAPPIQATTAPRSHSLQSGGFAAATPAACALAGPLAHRCRGPKTLTRHLSLVSAAQRQSAAG